MSNFTLKKTDRLTGEVRVKELFTKGDAFVAYPLRICYLCRNKTENALPVRVLFSVPKRRFKRAVDRNRIKRLMREAYRFNKQEFYTTLEKKDFVLDIAFSFIAEELPSFDKVNRKMRESLNKMEERV